MSKKPFSFYKFFHLFSGKRLLIGTVLLICLFLVSGGIGAFNVYLNGAESYLDYSFTLTWPFFLLFVFVGVLGLLKTVNGKGSVESLYGLIVVVFCYVCIEVLFKACGGFWFLGFDDALQLILVSVCTGFGLELAKELVRGLIGWVHGLREKVVKK